MGSLSTSVCIFRAQHAPVTVGLVFALKSTTSGVLYRSLRNGLDTIIFSTVRQRAAHFTIAVSFIVSAVADRRPTINFSMQELLVYAILAFIVIAVIWWVVKILRGFANGYRSVNKTDFRTNADGQKDGV